MVSRRAAVLAAALVVSGVGVASADSAVEPRPGELLSGKIKFPRAQKMAIHTGDGTRLVVLMGFDGRCRGGGLGELWVQNVPAKPDVKVREGRFAATLTGVSRNLGQERAGHFRWRLSGKFVEADVVTASVSGRAEVWAHGRLISRCTIAKPASVRLTGS